MREPLGFPVPETQFWINATPWPYLPCPMPNRLCSVGPATRLRRPSSGQAGRSGSLRPTEVLAALAGPVRWSFAVIGVVASNVAEYIRTLGIARRAGCHRGATGHQHATGLDARRQPQVRVTLDLRPASAVSPIDRGLLGSLPEIIGRRTFADELRDALAVVAIEGVVRSR